MVGLSVILENYKDFSAKKTPQVISKLGLSLIKPPSNGAHHHQYHHALSPNGGLSRSKNNLCFGSSSFLDNCFLCQKKLLPAKDIYMYKGDRAFCSEECRSRQIFMDELEESNNIIAAAKTGCTKEYNCSLSAIKRPDRPVAGVSVTATPSSSRSGGKGPKNHRFAC